MPYPKHALESFIKQYGQKEGERRFHAWKGANPGQYKKALSTAQREGPSHVVARSGRSSVVRRLLRKKAS